MKKKMEQRDLALPLFVFWHILCVIYRLQDV